MTACLAAAAVAGDPATTQSLPVFDFTQPDALAGWQPNRDIASLAGSNEGLVIRLAGDDPYVIGPPRDYPADVPLVMSARIKPDNDGMLQVFYFRDHASEERTVIAPVRAGRWNDVRAILPPLGRGGRLRIDPPGGTGQAIVARIDFEPAVSFPAPKWPGHEAFDTTTGLTLDSGPLRVSVAPQGFSLTVGGKRVAASHAHPLLGIVTDGGIEWIALDVPAKVKASGSTTIDSLQTLRDAGGGAWKIARRFTAVDTPGVVDLEVTVEVDRDRAVAFLPLVLLVAHEGESRKQQAVFPGLEYLADEPSSSEADLIGPQSRRQVPANHKIAFPLLAVANNDRVVALAWHHAPAFSAVFDSPDRLLASGGHLCGVIAPGSDGFNRHEGELMPIAPLRLQAGRPLVLRASLIGLAGGTVVPALKAYVHAHGLPRVPDVGDLTAYAAVAAAGWLDSGIRDGGRFRHAIGTNFPWQPAADAAMYTAWLAPRVADAAMSRRLDEASAAALAAVPAGSLDAEAVGHVRQPVQALLFGRFDETLAERAATARRLLALVRPDGTVAYRPGSDGVDYGRTHDADHASGLSARIVADALEAARFAGDGPLIDEALDALRRLGRKYAGSVPRGAQTWEVPLHTPDILASAHFVRGLTIGFELTGDRALLDEAVAWAWTGIPFLYLVDPVGTPDGPYGCVTVFGATAWRWPVWIGRPVQWCGLVYAHALYRLADHDPTGPWRQVADGITATGIRYSWPLAPPGASADAVERQGLLPDGWDVCEAFPVDPPVNPGTVQACAVELFGQEPLVMCRVFSFGKDRVIVHAPGEIEPRPAAAGGAADSVAFTVRGWPRNSHAVLITGLRARPDVAIDGRPVDLAPPHHFDPVAGRLVVWLEGPATLTLGREAPR